MSKYAFVYYGEPKLDSQEAGAAYQKKWQAWAGSLGEALIDPVIPLGKLHSAGGSSTPDNNGAKRLTGFSIVKASDIDAALAMAKGCPHLEHGTIDVAEVMDMGM